MFDGVFDDHFKSMGPRPARGLHPLIRRSNAGTGHQRGLWRREDKEGTSISIFEQIRQGGANRYEQKVILNKEECQSGA